MKYCTRIILLVLSLVLASFPASAQYPTRPIRLVVPYPAGGPTDALARIVGQALSPALGQPVIIENKPGADGAIAAQAVLTAPPDGYTYFFGGSTALVTIPLLRKNPPFDPVADFAPVSFIGRYSFCMFVNQDVPANTVAEFVKYARANPNKLNYATSNSTEYLAAAQFMKAAEITMVRVPYKGAAEAIPDLIAGRVQVDFVSMSAGLAHAKAGRLRMLAILLPRRSPAAPDVPTMTEAGMPGVSLSSWQGFFARANTPKELVDRVSRELNLILQGPEVRTQFDRLGFQGEGSTPEGLASILKDSLQTWGQLIRETGITQD